MNLADQPVAPVVVASASTEVDIPFNKLHISLKNTRIKPHSPVDIECRAASILAYGVLNRLQVIDEPSPDGTKEFGVIAGRGRYSSIELLVQRGLVPEDYPVKCDLRSVDDAIAISLAENANRTAPHEADQFVAFKTLADEGKSAETIAAHFGVTVRAVQQRMRLGGLHPELLDLYRNGKMGPEEVRAFCRSADQERQLQVWNGLASWNRSAHIIRSQLAADSLGTKDALVVFVGLDAYKQAGGTVTEDLFSQDTGDGFVEDLALLHQLAFDKLRAMADDIVAAEGWAWSDVRESFSYRDRQQFEQAKPQPREPNEAEQAELARLTSERDELTAKYDGLCAELTEMGEDEAEPEGEGKDINDSADPEADLQRQIEQVEGEIDRVNACIETINQSLLVYPEEVRAKGGVVVALDGRGAAGIVRGLIRPTEDAAQEQGPVTGANPSTTNGQSTTSPQSSVCGTGQGCVAPKKERAEVSERLALQLSAHRTAVMQTAMMEKPHVAMAAAVQRMLEAVTRRHRYSANDPVKISATSSFLGLHDKAPDLKGSRASNEVQAKIEAWRARVPASGKDELTWLLSLPGADLTDLFALCVALTLDVTTGDASKQPGVEVAAALQIDVADYWTATEASYLGSVSKDTIVAAVEEACGAGTGTSILKMKKGEAVKFAEQKLAGTRWLPAMLRAPVVDTPVAKDPVTGLPLIDSPTAENPVTGSSVADAPTNEVAMVG